MSGGVLPDIPHGQCITVIKGLKSPVLPIALSTLQGRSEQEQEDADMSLSSR